MNFKPFFFFIILPVIASACGVKGNNVFPRETQMPSLLENYPDIQTDQPLKETRKP